MGYGVHTPYSWPEGGQSAIHGPTCQVDRANFYRMNGATVAARALAVSQPLLPHVTYLDLLIVDGPGLPRPAPRRPYYDTLVPTLGAPSFPESN
jgi:hypothetical protein